MACGGLVAESLLDPGLLLSDASAFQQHGLDLDRCGDRDQVVVE